MLKKLKWIIYTKPFIGAAFCFVTLYLLTIRLRIKNSKALFDLLQQGKTVLICGWHQQFFPAINYFKIFAKYDPAIMISQSRDGEMISQVAHWVGWKTVRGSSSKGGKTAMNEMIAYLKTHSLAAHILDGPQGPIGKVKAGAIKMALESGAVIVPWYVVSENAWYFKSWDQFMLPKPFSKVMFHFGNEIRIDACKSDQEFEAYRLLLENTMKKWLILKHSV